MKNQKPFVVEIFVLLLVQVQAKCYWETSAEKYCGIWCTSTYLPPQETNDQVMTGLEQTLRERSQCIEEGIDLELMDGMDYQNFNVKANWFTAQVKVNTLLMGLNGVTTMDVNSFNSTAFKSLKKLVLRSVKFSPINNGVFNGLESLEILNLREASGLRVINGGVLDILSQTLKEFTLEQSNKYVSEISIDGFTGSEHLEKLEYVKYMYKLETSITHRSFVGLQSVKTLDLSECQIVSIGSGSFDPISSTIEVLKLEKNLILTLPDGIFSLMLPSSVTYIFLDGNKWNCSCELMPFKMNLLEYSNFNGSIQCNEPMKHRGYNVVDVEFCDSYVPPPTTTTIATTTTVTTTSSATPMTTTSISSSTLHDSLTTLPIETTPEISTESSTEPIEEFSQECFEPEETEVSKIVVIKTPRARLSINENENGNIEVQVETPIENSILIWFSSNGGTITKINCLDGAVTSYPVHDLTTNVAYTFCLMDSTETTVSPLDCISYTKQYDDEQPWLFENRKSFFISMVVVACSVCVFIGLAIGVLTLKVNEIVRHKRNHSSNQINKVGIAEALKETFESNSMQREKSRMSNVTMDSYNTKRTSNKTVQYYLENHYNPPPLPARPPSMHPFEEPIYATVRDTGVVK